MSSITMLEHAEQLLSRKFSPLERLVFLDYWNDGDLVNDCGDSQNCREYIQHLKQSIGTELIDVFKDSVNFENLKSALSEDYRRRYQEQMGKEYDYLNLLPPSMRID